MEKKNIGDFQIWKLYKIECKLYSIIYINQNGHLLQISKLFWI